MARNRRLVPMPRKRAASPLPPFEAPAVPVLSTPPPLQVQPPQSLLMQDFPYILLLAGAALAWIFLKPWFVLALVIVGLVLLVRGWIWLSMRFPWTMIFINSFIAALLGGARRRRW